MDLIAALRTFLRVAEIGSFSAVAAERGVTQPAISRQVSALEQHFGTRLVQRSTHAVTLTEEGRDLLPAMEQLVDSAEVQQNSDGLAVAASPSAVSALGAPVALGLYLSSQFGILLDRHEELSIDLVLHDDAGDLIEGGLDLQIWVGPISDSSLISRRIGATRTHLVAAPQYLKVDVLRQPGPSTCSSTTASSTTAGDATMSGCSPLPKATCLSPCAAGFGRTMPQPYTVPRFDGRGVALLSHLLVADDVREGRLCFWMPAFPPGAPSAFVVYLSRFAATSLAAQPASSLNFWPICFVPISPCCAGIADKPFAAAGCRGFRPGCSGGIVAACSDQGGPCAQAALNMVPILIVMTAMKRG